MIIPRIKSHIEGLPEVMTPVAEIRMSMAGDCARKVVMDFLVGRKPIGFQNYMRMESGHALHEMFHRIMRSSFGEDYKEEIECRYTFDGFGFEIVGHCDGVVNSLDAVVEFKSVSDGSFSMVMRDGKPMDSHIAQANLYAFALNRPRILIVYFNKDTAIFEEFLFDRDDELLASTSARIGSILQSVREKVVPEREYNDMTASPCWFCPHKVECYEGFSSQVKGLGPIVIEDGEFLSHAQALVSHRKERLTYEKKEESSKSKVGDVMLKLKTNETVAHGHKFIVTVGKNNNMLVSIKELK